MNQLQTNQREFGLLREQVKVSNTGTGIGSSDQQHSNRQTTTVTDDRSIVEEETNSGNHKGLFPVENNKLFEYNPNIQKLDLLSRAYKRMDYYSSPSSQNMSADPKYFGESRPFGAGDEIVISDDGSLSDSNSQNKGVPQADHEAMIRQLLRQHTEVTDLRELARPGASYLNNEVDDSYLAAISRSFGGC